MPSHRTTDTSGTRTPERGVKIVLLRAEKGRPVAGLICLRTGPLNMRVLPETNATGGLLR
jgi:hypothetical protein